MKKILYVGHSYHIKTQSTVFLINLLKRYYDVTLVADETWLEKPLESEIYNGDYYAIIFFQIMPSSKEIKQIKNKNIIFFPMFDGFPHSNISFYYRLRKIKVVNFSKTLHEKLLEYGISSIYVQYFPEPKDFNAGEENTAFFWNRVETININTVIKLFGDKKIKTHIHGAIDPCHEFIKPSKQNELDYSITYSNWFNTKEEMINVIKTKSIYIAPRESEGIGMSFLEAMAMGKCVIANNKPTMNEYIKDGITGYLFDINKPVRINLSNIEEVQKKAYEYIKDGYTKWIFEKEKIINFIEPAAPHIAFKYKYKYYLPLIPYWINIGINFILQSFIKIQFNETKGNFIRVFYIYVYDTRKKISKKLPR